MKLKKTKPTQYESSKPLGLLSTKITPSPLFVVKIYVLKVPLIMNFVNQRKRVFFILWRIEAKKGERGLFFVDNDPDDARKLLRCT